jgi:hypothetical protein
VTVLSVDLAYKTYSDIGVATLARSVSGVVRCHFHDLPLSSSPVPIPLAEHLAEIAATHGARLILLDGPQGWRSAECEAPHSRLCERLLNTPAKSGLPGHVKPANYRPFVEFSISVFDALEAIGWPRLSEPRSPDHCAVETFPLSAWRALGIPALPAKRKSCNADLIARLNDLRARFAMECSSDLNHDQLQALIAGLAGVELLAGNQAGYLLTGLAPRYVEGSWREGFIANPLPVPRAA